MCIKDSKVNLILTWRHWKEIVRRAITKALWTWTLSFGVVLQPKVPYWSYVVANQTHTKHNPHCPQNATTTTCSPVCWMSHLLFFFFFFVLESDKKTKTLTLILLFEQRKTTQDQILHARFEIWSSIQKLSLSYFYLICTLMLFLGMRVMVGKWVEKYLTQIVKMWVMKW